MGTAQNENVIPELANGFEINWQKYTPTGGKEFHERWVEHGRDILAKYMAGAFANFKATQDKLANAYGVQAAIKAAQNAIVEAETYASNIDGGANPERKERISALLREAVAAIPPVDIDALREENARSQKEAEFANAFIEMIDLDNVLDRTIYAMYHIPMKYRAKVLREVARRCTTMEELIAKAKLALPYVPKELNEYLGTIHKEISFAWSVTFVSIRAMKRAADKHGIGAAFSDEHCFDSLKAADRKAIMSLIEKNPEAVAKAFGGAGKFAS